MQNLVAQGPSWADCLSWAYFEQVDGPKISGGPFLRISSCDFLSIRFSTQAPACFRSVPSFVFLMQKIFCFIICSCHCFFVCFTRVFGFLASIQPHSLFSSSVKYLPNFITVMCCCSPLVEFHFLKNLWNMRHEIISQLSCDVPWAFKPLADFSAYTDSLIQAVLLNSDKHMEDALTLVWEKWAEFDL